MSCLNQLLASSFILMLAGCGGPDEHGTTTMGGLMGEASTGFTPVVADKHLSFPADHLAHDDFRQEWWYLTANLTTETGKPLGLQWTQFRIALSPQVPQSPSKWASNQLYMAHSAVTTAKQHKAEERWSRGQAQLAGVSSNPLTIQLDNWRWQSQDNDLFPATLDVTGDDFSYSLNLTTSASYQRQGDKGYSVKSADGSVASYYYSQPFISVAGTVTLDGERLKVSGNAWLDREWSSQFLNKHQQGWDWFAIRLDDGSALMLFQLRGIGKRENAFYSARRMFADGSGRNINSNMLPGAIEMRPTDWQGNYPVAWQISIPSEQLELTIQPLNRNSSMPLAITYWEGPISVQGSHNGLGYMELTGYETH